MASLNRHGGRGAARLIAAGFGAGWTPLAPGTVGSLVGLIAGALALASEPAVLPVLAILATIGGHAAVRSAVDPHSDPGWVVIDEIAGQLIAMLPFWLWPAMFGASDGSEALWLLAAFVLFRFFDITKLGPVGWADRQHGAFGIMADDVIAGAIAAVLIAAAMVIAG